MNRFQIVERYRQCKVPLLLLGPPGVGKTDVATRIDPNLLRVNCAELRPELIAAELFGTLAGGFTDAVNRPGLVESASTLFLDEAGELPSELQARLLMLLDEGRYRPAAALASCRPTCGSSSPPGGIRPIGSVRTCSTGSASTWSPSRH